MELAYSTRMVQSYKALENKIQFAFFCYFVIFMKRLLMSTKIKENVWNGVTDASYMVPEIYAKGDDKHLPNSWKSK